MSALGCIVYIFIVLAGTDVMSVVPTAAVSG